ncbi:hypothetical protein EOL25_25130, partial [Citrobacter freundii]
VMSGATGAATGTDSGHYLAILDGGFNLGHRAAGVDLRGRKKIKKKKNTKNKNTTNKTKKKKKKKNKKKKKKTKKK